MDWAISDLTDKASGSPFCSAAKLSEENLRRIDWLFDNDLHDLPDEHRPDCHRLKDHGYRSVYGRMHADMPAPTITTNFATPGCGRFIHPTRRRTLTCHEAARLQGFPDWFDFAGPARSSLQRMIGNAVPSILGHMAATELLG